MNAVEEFKANRGTLKDSTNINNSLNWEFVKVRKPISSPNDLSVGPKYYNKPLQESPKQSVSREEWLKKNWIRQYVKPTPDKPGSVDWDRFAYEGQDQNTIDMTMPIRVIKRAADPEENDTTYHRNKNYYMLFGRHYEHDPKIKNSEFYKNQLLENKKLYEFFRGIWEEQQATKK